MSSNIKHESVKLKSTAAEAEGNQVACGRVRVACSLCNLRELCVPGGNSPADLSRLDTLVSSRRKVKRGESLFRVGDEFKSLYAVSVGFFKSRISGGECCDQITGFQLPGELLGLDGLATEHHTVDAIALQDSEVCVLPYAELERIARDFQPLQHQLHRVMSREIVREHGVMLLLGSMRAEERVAAFLLNLSERYKSLGYSPTEFVLRMTREEIGSYLGLKLETVSRAFSHFSEKGLITAQGKHIHLKNLKCLRKVVDDATSC
jgi:CRP/FNR family transcriptional regulator